MCVIINLHCEGNTPSIPKTSIGEITQRKKKWDRLAPSRARIHSCSTLCSIRITLILLYLEFYWPPKTSTWSLTESSELEKLLLHDLLSTWY